MKRLLLPFSLLAILSISCVVPAPISQVSPSEETDFIWTNGREVITQYKDSISVEVSYYENQEGLLIFDVTIANQSNRVITIDPQQFSYLPVSKKGDTLNVVKAINPEYQILEQQKNISKLDAQRKREANQALIFGSLELIGELADNNTAQEEHSRDYPSSFDRYEMEVAEIDYKTLNIVDRKSFWENQALRKTTLFPDYYTSGQVFLRYKKEIQKMGLLYTHEKTIFEFWFDHHLITHKDF